LSRRRQALQAGESGMTEQWYYASGSQQLGPVSTEVLRRLAETGELRPADLGWKEGMPNWTPAGLGRGGFPEGAPAAAAAPTAVPPPGGASPYGLSPDPFVTPTPAHPAGFGRDPAAESCWGSPPRRSSPTGSNPQAVIAAGVLILVAGVAAVVAARGGL